MKTHFASPERLDRAELAADINAAVENPVIDGLLNTVSGLLAVLNEHRQIVAVNDALLQALGIDDASLAMGLRPGEAIGCVYSEENEGGCGTASQCASCGAAIAIVSCMTNEEPVQRTCSIHVDRDGVRSDLFLLVRAIPIASDGQRLILLFLQDITEKQQWEALGRIFFHDISNIIHGLVGSSEILMLESGQENREIIDRIRRLSLRLAREVQMQKHLTQWADDDYHPFLQPVSVEQLFEELDTAFSNHPAARQRRLLFADRNRQIVFQSDFFILVRVMTNMILNALEATDKGETVKVWVVPDDDCITFCVWNHQMVPNEVAGRIFQRNVSTKARSGRGLGTYSMKLFGERFLKGRVRCATSVTEGTTFSLQLPTAAADHGKGILTPF